MVKVDQLIEGARDAITVKRVYGDPIVQNGVAIIPAAAVRGGAEAAAIPRGTGAAASA
jgi:uncharacterized spore protein YtfJ